MKKVIIDGTVSVMMEGDRTLVVLNDEGSVKESQGILTIWHAETPEKGEIGWVAAESDSEPNAVAVIASRVKGKVGDSPTEKENPFLALAFYLPESIDILIARLEDAKKILIEKRARNTKKG